MSKKYKRRSQGPPRRAPVRQLPADSQEAPAKPSNLDLVKSLMPMNPMTGADSYSNAAAFLGDDSPIMSAGYFARSNISQNIELLSSTYRGAWLARRIIDVPSEDTTRAWYSLSTDLSEEELDDLRRLEAKHSIKQELTNAIRWARLYGGSIALMVVRGDEDRLDEPLEIDDLFFDCFQGVLVLDRTQGVDPSIELVDDLDDPDFGLPMYYNVTTDIPGEFDCIKIHHSRVLRFIGEELPYVEMQRENYWGASTLEHVWDELMKRSATSANIAQLVFQANITTLKMSDFGEVLAMGSDTRKQKVLAAIQEENRMRTSFGLQLLSSEDQMETHPYSFSGISDVYEAFMMDMAGAAEIPATKLFGRSPQGFNSTGESDLKNYYEMIVGLQERLLRPALEKLLPVMAMSCWGQVPEDLQIIFEPVMTTSAQDRADLIQKTAQPIIAAFQAGIIDRYEAISELKAQGLPLGAWLSLPDVSDMGSDPAEYAETEEMVQEVINEILYPSNEEEPVQ